MNESSEKARLSGGRIGGGGGETRGLLGAVAPGSAGIRAGTRRRMFERRAGCTVWSVDGVTGEFASEIGIPEKMG